LALLVDREVNLRSERKQTRLLHNAQLKFPRAAIEDFDNRTGRGIERKAFMSLALSQWITRGDTILLTGPTEYVTWYPSPYVIEDQAQAVAHSLLADRRLLCHHV
jgi:hypothetical protein